MSPTELYSLLFFDSFMSGFIFSGQPLVITAMKILGGHDMRTAGFIYATGITFAAAIQWAFGRILLCLRKELPTDIKNPYVDQAFELIRKYGYLLGLLGFIPFLGSFFVIMCGLARGSLPRIVSLFFIVNVIVYCFLLA